MTDGISRSIDGLRPMTDAELDGYAASANARVGDHRICDSYAAELADCLKAANAEIERLTDEAADIIQRLSDRLEAANADADRLVARLRVHATDEATGYVQDPESEGNDVDFPGMSERWCAADQFAIAAHDARAEP